MPVSASAVVVDSAAARDAFPRLSELGIDISELTALLYKGADNAAYYKAISGSGVVPDGKSLLPNASSISVSASKSRAKVEAVSKADELHSNKHYVLAVSADGRKASLLLVNYTHGEVKSVDAIAAANVAETALRARSCGIKDKLFYAVPYSGVGVQVYLKLAPASLL